MRHSAIPMAGATAVLLLATPAHPCDWTFIHTIDLGDALLAGGQSHTFGVGLGGTPLCVVGFSVEFDYSEPYPDSSLASDLRVIITAPDSTTYTVGGFDTPSDANWSFQGPGSNGPGHYGDHPDDIFLHWLPNPQPNEVWLGELVNDRGFDFYSNLYQNIQVHFYVGPVPCDADVNGNDMVDVGDLMDVILHWDRASQSASPTSTATVRGTCST